MPSDRKVITFRPDEAETQMVRRLAHKHGLSMARVIGVAIRQMAERKTSAGSLRRPQKVWTFPHPRIWDGSPLSPARPHRAKVWDTPEEDEMRAHF